MSHQSTTSTIQRGLTRTDFEHLREISGHTCAYCESFDHLQSSREARAAHNLFATVDALDIIARGYSLPAAWQGALVLAESAHVPACGTSASNMRHGRVELAGPVHRAIVVSPRGATAEMNDRLAMDLAAAGSRVVLIANAPVALAHPNLMALQLGAVPEEAFSLLGILPIELLCVEVGLRRGLAPGGFTFGAKVTAVEK